MPITPLSVGCTTFGKKCQPPTDMSSPRHDADTSWLIEIWNRKGYWETSSTAWTNHTSLQTEAQVPRAAHFCHVLGGQSNIKFKVQIFLFLHPNIWFLVNNKVYADNFLETQGWALWVQMDDTRRLNDYLEGQYCLQRWEWWRIGATFLFTCGLREDSSLHCIKQIISVLLWCPTCSGLLHLLTPTTKEVNSLWSHFGHLDSR